MSRQFTREEADARTGREVKTRVAWLGVAAGTRGTVIKPDSLGEVWSVIVRWDGPGMRQDWFTKDEYEKFLEEVVPGLEGKHEV